MSQIPKKQDPDPRYEALDVCVQQYISAEEFAWLPDEAKATIEEDLTTPSCVE